MDDGPAETAVIPVRSARLMLYLVVMFLPSRLSRIQPYPLLGLRSLYGFVRLVKETGFLHACKSRWQLMGPLLREKELRPRPSPRISDLHI